MSAQPDVPMRRNCRWWMPIPMTLLLTVAVGCGSAETYDVIAVAHRFGQAVESGAGSAACDLLAPRTRDAVARDGDGSCAAGLERAGLGSMGVLTSGRATVEIVGHGAQLSIAGQALFLARFDDGWRITAAGCTRVSEDPAIPYDCDLGGD